MNWWFFLVSRVVLCWMCVIIIIEVVVNRLISFVELKLRLMMCCFWGWRKVI